ncbi:MAG: hypothetical protein ABJO27_22855 [Pseudoruegeria sp.]
MGSDRGDGVWGQAGWACFVGFAGLVGELTARGWPGADAVTGVEATLWQLL